MIEQLSAAGFTARAGDDCIEVFDANGVRIGGVHFSRRVWWTKPPKGQAVTSQPFRGPGWRDRLTASFIEALRRMS